MTATKRPHAGGYLSPQGFDFRKGRLASLSPICQNKFSAMSLVTEVGFYLPSSPRTTNAHMATSWQKIKLTSLHVPWFFRDNTYSGVWGQFYAPLV